MEADRDARPSLAEQIPRLSQAQLGALVQVSRAGGRLPRATLRRDLAAALLGARTVTDAEPQHLRITGLGVLALIRAANPISAAPTPGDARVRTAITWEPRPDRRPPTRAAWHRPPSDRGRPMSPAWLRTRRLDLLDRLARRRSASARRTDRDAAAGAAGEARAATASPGGPPAVLVRRHLDEEPQVLCHAR